MPVTKDKATGKYRIGSGKTIYERKAAAVRAYQAYLAKRSKKLKQKVEIEVEVPEGYEVTAEYRYPKAFELFINTEGEMVMSDVDCRRSKHFIVRKKAI